MEKVVSCCNSKGSQNGRTDSYCNDRCEPAYITYTGGTTFKCSDMSTAKAVTERTYKVAVELFAMLCQKFSLDPLADGVIISHKEGHARGIASNHGDPQHLWNQLGMGYTMDGFRQDVFLKMGERGVVRATDLKNLSEQEIIEKVGPLFTQNQKVSGVLASVSLAQFILESNYGKSELALNANNCFGMKKSLSGNTWNDSTWDGKSIYIKCTKEQNSDGSYKTITADFRKYPSISDSIADHSAYLLGAKNGSNFRYAGIAGKRDYREVAQIIKDGGYATSLTYVDKLCRIIEKWNLTKYDFTSPDKTESKPSSSYPATPFIVKVIVPDLNYRAEPTMGANVRGQTGIGTFTIVEVKNGWGHLKSGIGWIWLGNAAYCRIGSTIAENKPVVTLKPVEEVACEVIRGEWGNGTERKARLTAAGYDYAAIQHRVNELLS